jgi:hypothetical protein
VKFDLNRLETSNSPVLLADDLAANPVHGGGQFDPSAAGSDHGTLVFAGKNAAQTWMISWLGSSATTSPSITVWSGIGVSAFTMAGYRALKSLSLRDRS